MRGEVYSEIMVRPAPDAYVREATYQIASVTPEDGRRVTVRNLGKRVTIGDAVSLREDRDGVLYFSKT